MRVAIITESFLPAINGVTNTVLRVLEHLERRGDHGLVIAPSDPRPMPSHYCQAPIYQTASLPLAWYHDLRFSTTTTSSLEKILSDFCPDVVHLASPMILGYKGVLAAQHLNLPSVALYQTQIPQYIGQYGYRFAMPWAWHYLRKLHNRATLTLAPSSATKDELICQGFTNVHVWGRGVDTQRFSPEKRDADLHAHWSTADKVVVGYMGRLSSEKQVEDLAILTTVPNIQLVIIGDGPQRKSLEKLLPHAIFTGMLTGDDLPRYLASLDIFIHPGQLETFGQAIQEAQACGLPTIAPAKGGPLDLIQASHNGWLYPANDCETMAAYVEDLAGDQSKREAFGRRARHMVESRTWPALCDQLIDYYEQAIETLSCTRGHNLSAKS